MPLISSLSQGVRLIQVRKAIDFRQEAWIAPYIAENTRLRQAAVDKFEKDCYKLLNNAFFGKTMENVKKRVKIELVNKGRSHVWQTSKPSFKRFEIFDENLVGVEVSQTCKNVYREHLYRLRSQLDFSNLAEDKPLFSNENKAVVCKFKDETEGIPLREFIGKITYNLNILNYSF